MGNHVHGVASAAAAGRHSLPRDVVVVDVALCQPHDIATAIFEHKIAKAGGLCDLRRPQQQKSVGAFCIIVGIGYSIMRGIAFYFR